MTSATSFGLLEIIMMIEVYNYFDADRTKLVRGKDQGGLVKNKEKQSIRN